MKSAHAFAQEIIGTIDVISHSGDLPVFVKIIELRDIETRHAALTEAAEVAAQFSAIMPHYSQSERAYAQARGEASKSILSLRDSTK